MSYRSTLLVGVIAFLLASWPAKAQVWVDTSQSGGRLPEWVDPKYYHPTPPTEPAVHEPRCIWVEPVYRSVCRRVWHEPAMQTICERVWIDGHYDSREVVSYDPAGCRCVRPEQVWVPGHYENRQRQVVVIPGYWVEAMVRELVTPGHWESIAMRD